jgi:hypothetical protein
VAKTKKKSRLGEELRRLGFDLSRYCRADGYYRVRCSQCEALVINGIPSHETGCPNTPKPRRPNHE